MSLYKKHVETIDKAINAIGERIFFAQYPEHPKAYGTEAPELGKNAYFEQLNKPFTGLLQTDSIGVVGEEKSPFTNELLGIKYPTFSVDSLIERGNAVKKQWSKVSIEERAGILVESLERVANRFHEIAWATNNTTGQSPAMSFQASGPHSADRALESLAFGLMEMKRFPDQVQWDKPMGRITLSQNKTYRAIPKGIGLIIGCSTFPTWNSVPGLYANLITGNPSIIKPHPASVYPIAIYISVLQSVLEENGLDPHIVQMAADDSENLITKKLAEHPDVKLIDFTGSSNFGSYIESLEGKTIFTEKAGVNSVIIDSAKDMREVMRNLAFSVSLYSGQMCTAPQNFFIPESGVETELEKMTYEQVVDLLRNEVASLALNKKMSGILGALNSEQTLERVKNVSDLGGTIVLESHKVVNQEFANARISAPTIIEVDATNTAVFSQELFGPILIVIKTKDTDHSVELAKKLVIEKGALTCAVYTSDEEKAAFITEEMNEVFAPVSLNFTGFSFVNQHAAFSDFHGTGGNPAGNASFSDPLFVNRRFVWVGNRKPA